MYESCIELTRAVGGRRGRGRPQRGVRDAEAHFLAFHVAAGLRRGRCLIDAQRFQARIARLLGDIRAERQRHEDDEHRGQHRPALARVADHRAERVAQRRRDQQDREHLEEVRQRRRVLERMRGVHVEESAAVRAELLDRDLARRRSQRNRLLRDLLGLRHGVAGCIEHRLHPLILDRHLYRHRLEQIAC